MTLAEQKVKVRAKLSVGFSSFVLQSGLSGISTYIENLLPALLKANPNNHYDVFIPECDRHVLQELGSQERLISTSSHFTRPIPSILWHNLVLPRITKKQKYDCIHIPTYRRIPAIKKCPVVATVHDLAPLSYSRKYGRLHTLFNATTVPRLIEGCDHVVAVSHYTKQDILRYSNIPEEKVSVIYSGIDHDIYRRAPEDEAWQRLGERYNLNQPFMIYVSRLEYPGKNHLNLIRAFESFKRRNQTQHQLVLVGADWPGVDQIRAAAAASEFAHDIHILGFVPTQDVVALYSVCDLMVHPSYFEGFGFPVVEASACGARVICSNNSSLRELGKLGNLPMFVPGDMIAIRSCMETALSQEWTQADRAEAVRFADQFQWNETANRLLDVYEMAANSGSR